MYLLPFRNRHTAKTVKRYLSDFILSPSSSDSNLLMTDDWLVLIDWEPFSLLSTHRNKIVTFSHFIN